jgi:hypothetical protein
MSIMAIGRAMTEDENAKRGFEGFLTNSIT